MHFFDNAVKLDPGFPDGHYARGVLNWKMGDPRAAAEDLRNALAAGDDSWPHRDECQKVLSILPKGGTPGRYEEAIALRSHESTVSNGDKHRMTR